MYKKEFVEIVLFRQIVQIVLSDYISDKLSQIVLQIVLFVQIVLSRQKTIV